MATHKELILDHLRQHGSITQAEAFREYGCTRLGARIWDLVHKDGHLIVKTMETGKNRFGSETRYARYSLVFENDGQS